MRADIPGTTMGTYMATPPTMKRTTITRTPQAIMTSKGERVEGTWLWVLEDAAYVASKNDEFHSLWINRRRNNAISMLRSLLWLFISLEPGIAAGCAEYFDSAERTQFTLESIETTWWIFEAIHFEKTTQQAPCYPRLIQNKKFTWSKIPRCSSQRESRDCSTLTDSTLRLNTSYIDYFEIKAAGTFLWVLEAAQKLPAGLPTLYNRMLTAINTKHRSTAARVFKWIALAVRSLSLLELATIACVTPQYGLTLEQSARDLVAACGPMIAIKENPPYQNSFDTMADVPTVGFVHSSVEEYLRGLTVMSENALPDFRIAEDMAELELVQTCIQCLQDSGLHRSPGLESVEQYFKRAAAVSGNEQEIWRSYEFFLPESVVRHNWSWGASQPLMKVPPLAVAAYLGVLPWAKHILTNSSQEAVLRHSHDIDVTTRPDCQIAFVFAVLGQQLGLARRPLDSNGAAVNCADDAGIIRSTPLAASDVSTTALDIVLDQQERVPRAITFVEVIQLLKFHGAIANNKEKESLEEQAERGGRWEEAWPESGLDRRPSSHSPVSSSGSYSPRFWAGARAPRHASSFSDLASPLEDQEDVWLSRRASLAAWQRKPDRRLSSRSTVRRQRSHSPTFGAGPRLLQPANSVDDVASLLYISQHAKVTGEEQ
ncbi:hypothetical protein AC579_9353 [Pseudocercospora musae]|uniref:Uncharacterized protein n=1 Tax=Pseudocercospora musae TaxID=113226 RepID=A0A139H0S9_9PEZI|nr:hypothetical protein AC579_9353 [Pseudocercospora musae]